LKAARKADAPSAPYLQMLVFRTMIRKAPALLALPHGDVCPRAQP